MKTCFGHMIYKIGDYSKIMWPVRERKRCMMQKSKTKFNNMLMTTFRETIMFKCMGRCGKVRNTMMSHEEMKCKKFAYYHYKVV